MTSAQGRSQTAPRSTLPARTAGTRRLVST